MTPEQLLAQFRTARATLTARLTAGLERAWRRTAGPTDDDERAWLLLAVPLVVGAMRAIGRLTEAHQRRLLMTILDGDAALRRRLDAIDTHLDQIIANVRGGVTPQQVYGRSIISIRRALAQGRPYMEGFQGGLGKAVTAAETDLALIHVETSNVVLLREDLYLNSPKYGGRSQGGINGITGPGFRQPLRGVRRVLSPPSCGICVADAETIYPPGTRLRLHPRCDCTVAPVLADNDFGAALNRPRLDRLTNTVAVARHDHGELGPILTDARTGFRELGDLQTSPRQGQGATRDGRVTT